MKALFSIITLFAFCNFATADTVVAARNIRSNSILVASDFKLITSDTRNGFQSIEDIVGQEARVALYAGRPVVAKDVGPPALVKRNQIVTLAYITGSLQILTEGRSLARGGVGDRIRVLNLSSRASVIGIVNADGTVSVSGSKF